MVIDAVVGVVVLEEPIHSGFSGEDMGFQNRRIVMSAHVFLRRIQHQVVASTRLKRDAVVVDFRDGPSKEVLDLQPVAPPLREH